MSELIARNENPHAWDIDGRPLGTRHELRLDRDNLIVREVWFWSDNGEESHADEVVMPLNSFVHLVVNMTVTERAHFANTRTCAPARDWDDVQPSRHHDVVSGEPYLDELAKLNEPIDIHDI